MKTLALVIGNNNYHESAKLNYAIKDAQGVADVFSRLGYDVLHKSDINNFQAGELLTSLENIIAGYDATIFYFAGHGFQFNGENYLTTTECQIPPADVHNCRRNSIQLSELLDIFKRNPDKINIIIIDACRRSFDRGVDNTFAPVQAPQGTLIAFSTSPGNGAKDGGFGEHGIYTGALLQYIGREYLSVEELFKKVRRTVFNHTDGAQTPWEHTSLIGDFYFNMGQLVYSVDIPYSDFAVKDVEFKELSDNFSKLIYKLKSYNWDNQNAAIGKLLTINPKDLDKNQEFILGRNLLQAACGGSYAARDFFADLRNNIQRYNLEGENHVLNGILFEIYFNKYGDFRKDNFKMGYFDQVMAIRKYASFTKSFQFIANALAPFINVKPFWMPSASDVMIDIDVRATRITSTDWNGNDTIYEQINKIVLGTSNIIDNMRNYRNDGLNNLGLQQNIAHFLAAPKELVNINGNIKLNRIVLQPKESSSLNN